VRHAAEAVHLEVAALHGSGPAGRVVRADVEAVAPRPTRRTPISPRARRLAATLGVDLAALGGQGAGPGHSIVAADVLAAGRSPTAAEAAPPVPPPPDRMRRAIAAAMERSWREIPHYHVATRIDVSRPMAWLSEENLRRPVRDRLLPAVLLLRATALAAAQRPELNGWWIEGSFRAAERVDLGVAVSLRSGGLVVPVITGADRLDLDQLMARLRDLVTRARRARLRSSELIPASITVTDLGDVGVDTVHGVIHAPQVALVGFGAIREEPWAEGGMLAVRPVVHATVAGDHRASDGRTGARFLSTIGALLEEAPCLTTPPPPA
jgi:pyruvate dehydrogenase E2 component (dihydrolipoamide acetyltransferase)